MHIFDLNLVSILYVLLIHSRIIVFESIALISIIHVYKWLVINTHVRIGVSVSSYFSTPVLHRLLLDLLMIVKHV